MTLIKDTYYLIYLELDCLSKINFRLVCKMFMNFKFKYCGKINHIKKNFLNRITTGIICVKCKFTYFKSKYENLSFIMAKKFNKLIFGNFYIDNISICYINSDLKIFSLDNKIPDYIKNVLPALKLLLNHERTNCTKFRDYIRLLHFKDISKNLV